MHRARVCGCLEMLVGVDVIHRRAGNARRSGVFLTVHQADTADVVGMRVAHRQSEHKAIDVTDPFDADAVLLQGAQGIMNNRAAGAEPGQHHLSVRVAAFDFANTVG